MLSAGAAARPAEDRVSRTEIRNRRTSGSDGSGDVGSGDVSFRGAQPGFEPCDVRRAGETVPVGRVQRRGMNPDQDVVVADVGHPDIAELEPARRTVAFVDEAQSER